MADTPLTAYPIRSLSPLDQGSALMDGKGPFALQDALRQQQQAAQQPDAPQEEPLSPQEALIEALKAEKDSLSQGNKVKELALAIEAELGKRDELDQRLKDNPQALQRLRDALKGLFQTTPQ